MNDNQRRKSGIMTLTERMAYIDAESKKMEESINQMCIGAGHSPMFRELGKAPIRLECRRVYSVAELSYQSNYRK